MKCKKYNSKTKWINTSFANPYRKAIGVNSALHAVYTAQSIASGAAVAASINASTFAPAVKSAGMASSTLCTANAIKDTQDKRKKREAEIKQKWGVK